jgi:23S rRNA (cytidine1920-2'-O)/16S rRNA (cytidine1409-2'-O)-methyltransferase
MSGDKVRLDVLLVKRGLSDSRESAKARILAGDVRVGGAAARRPSVMLEPSADVTLVAPSPYVSRGGYKLAHALDAFSVDVRGSVVVDVGASTGGFTDVLLQRGCARVYAVDVGYGQLAWKLRQDSRVVVLDRTNVRYLESLPELAQGAVVDTSFISLTLVLPAVVRLLDVDGWIVALVKPQFEAGRSAVGKGGVVRDPAVHREVLTRLLTFAATLDLAVADCTPSPILGPAGNREFLAYFRRGDLGLPVDRAVGRCLVEAAPPSGATAFDEVDLTERRDVEPPYD